jgi:(p)ppGpp synthase/HD superfamily hydrolase
MNIRRSEEHRAAMNSPMNRFGEALALANEWHAPQLRKATTIPYISHLMSVSALVMEYGGNQDQAIAALLHDAIEDAESAGEAIRRRALILGKFGPRVAAIVEGCTDGVPGSTGEKPDWKTRKEAYLTHLMEAPMDTLLVSCADKLHNARAIVSDLRQIGPEVFQRFKAGREGTLWYYQRLAEVFTTVLPGFLALELSRTVQAMLMEAGALSAHSE